MSKLTFEFRIVKLLISIVFFLFLVNPLIKYFDTSNIAAFLISLFLVIASGLRITVKRFLPVIVYVSILLIITVLGFILTKNDLDTFNYVLLLILIPIFWIFAIERYGHAIVIQTLKMLPKVAIIIATLAFIQFFLSPDLFNLLDYRSDSIDWANNLDFQNYKLFFRASSITGSPQVLGALSAFLFITLICSPFPCNYLSKLIFLSLIFMSGILSGSKVFFVLILVGFIIKMLLDKKKLIIKTQYFFVGLIFLLLILYFFLNQDTPYAISRIININEFFLQEERDSRLDRIYEILLITDPLIGNGYTKTLFTELTAYNAIESLFLKIFFHFGFFSLIALVSILFFSYINCQGKLKTLIKVTNVLFFISMTLSCAIESPLFFPFWGIIIAGLMPAKEYDTIR